MPSVVCTATGKVVYATKGEATRALARFKAGVRIRGKKRQVPNVKAQTVYWCYQCGLWHLGHAKPLDRDHRKPKAS